MTPDAGLAAPALKVMFTVAFAPGVSVNELGTTLVQVIVPKPAQVTAAVFEVVEVLVTRITPLCPMVLCRTGSSISTTTSVRLHVLRVERFGSVVGASASHATRPVRVIAASDDMRCLANLIVPSILDRDASLLTLRCSG